MLNEKEKIFVQDPYFQVPRLIEFHRHGVKRGNHNHIVYFVNNA